MQAAFKTCHGLQCGFCTPGMVMSAIDLVHAPRRTAASSEIREGLDGNLCRCTGYQNIVKAVAAGRRGDGQVKEDTTMNAPQGFIGQRVERREDARFLTGRGQYTDDITLPQPDLRACSCARRTRTRRINGARHVAAAQGAPACSASSPASTSRPVGGLPCGWLINNIDGTPMKEPKHPVLADGKVRYVGDRVALVVAETLRAGQGRGGADRGRLRRAAGGRRPRQARQAPAAPVHDEAPDNICYHWGIGDKAGVDAAFKTAAHVTRLQLPQQPADAERDRAARGQRAVQRRPTTATRCTSPTRTRTSSGC